MGTGEPVPIFFNTLYRHVSRRSRVTWEGVGLCREAGIHNSPGFQPCVRWLE
jgi:hypothetical protein